MPTSTLRNLIFLACTSALACAGPVDAPEPVGTSQEALSHAPPPLAFDFANITEPIAGVAGTDEVVFVGEPLNGTVLVLSRLTGKQIALLTPPPEGFAIPLIMHNVGNN